MLELLQTSPLLAVVATLLFSLLVGSFLNVVILRLPVMMQREWDACIRAEAGAQAESGNPASEPERFNLMVPRSRCGHCGHEIQWYENIPVLSWLFLRGRCSQCSTPISARYPFVELLTGIGSAWLVWHFGFTLEAGCLVLLTWALITLTFIDLDHQLLPDSITLPLLWLGLLINTQGVFVSLHEAVLGAAAGYLLLWSVYWLFKLLTGKEGMGYGDFKLLAAIGAWGGLMVLPLVVLLSSVVGVVLAFGLIAFRRHQAQNPLPFGPYLAIAGWIAMVWGDSIISAYLGSF
ncbi:prepilin peptidase [Marinobacterium sp. AK62]|uniref:Prepilin leader peptidase/N-methyltransferase n=1 Tax=Marinobacterium alkalitolerans TaxID=1542925 RepID=A0ABS3ZAZ7_9GAMM|nr:A24 family peptidase [Marinobacterium alkalitolerans]MBP0048876.1 prepilin peptidase [Marinobacterium alkalitolerans]